MTTEITPALYRAIQAAHEASALGDVLPWHVLAEDTLHGMARYLRVPLAAALDVDALTLEIVQATHPTFWDPEHRAALLSINPDEATVDRVLEQRRTGAIEAQRSAVRLVRAAILGNALCGSPGPCRDPRSDQ